MTTTHAPRPVEAQERIAAIAREIAVLAARIGGIPQGDADPAMPFALMGIDSVGAIELVAAVEVAFNVALPLDAAAEYQDATALARCVALGLQGHARVESAADPFDQMFRDAVLPRDIRPSRASFARQTASLIDAERILLTGASGFLGSWLARELLDRSAATLLCLVRPTSNTACTRELNAATPLERLRRGLLAVGVDDDVFNERVRVLEGDLSSPGLGLSPQQFDALGEGVDAICHAGATVNWVLPYRALAAANVGGTLTLLRLASRRSIPFHFISSLSVCYSTSAPASVDGDFDALRHIRGLHLGYAQTKAVAEALVREAGGRGLPITIYRPSFISGDSEHGGYNRDDILARIVCGCVRMGTAPELDWTIDCTPVDTTAADIVRLSSERGVLHLGHPEPRHWRECVLWMRLYGYDVRLVPYHAWLRQLEAETSTSGDPSHPLRPMRSFFLSRPHDGNGATLPELMLASRRSTPGICGEEHHQPRLDASLLEQYFKAFTATGDLPPGRPLSRPPATTRGFDERALSELLGSPVVAAHEVGRLADHSIIGELTAWRSGRATGLFRYRVQHDDGSRDVVMKIKPHADASIAVGEALTAVCDARLGAAYARFADKVGLAGAHVRELAIYEQTDPRFTAHAPALLGSRRDDPAQTWTLALEYLSDVALRNAVNAPGAWTPDAIDRVLHGLAALHAIWYQRENELLSCDWLGFVASTDSMSEMQPLWEALASHAAPRFAAWADPSISSIQRRLIASFDRWWPILDRQPRTLIHNDFNPRNICLRRAGDDLQLAAYDWELAAIGVPQHDLAEFLCFVLPSDSSDADIDLLIDRYRRLLEDQTRTSIDAEEWRRGFSSALNDLIVNRLSMYAVIDRIRRQPFLPRIIRTWHRLYRRLAL